MDEKVPQVPTEDAAVARVRAADPAADAAPDTVALRTTVDERRAEPTGVVPDELAARRARRWTALPAKIAGVAAAALLVGGGGGYAIGAGGAGGADDGGADVVADADTGAAAPEITLTDPQRDAGEESFAVPEEAPMPGFDRYWGGGGRTIFTSSGLSEDGATLHAWGFDAAAAYSEQTITAAAAALGVPGAAQQRDGAWVVGPNDGTGPSVQIYSDGTASLNYWDPTKELYFCAPPSEIAPDAGGGTDAVQPPDTEPADTAKSDTAASDTAGSGTGESSAGVSGAVEPGVVAPEPAPDPCQQRDFGPAPTGGDAEQVLRDALAALGLDPGAFEYQVDNYVESPEVSYVSAYQVVDAQRSGLAWSGSLTGAGLSSLYGPMAPLVDIGEYPVISPVDAVERLMDPRFGSGYSGPLYYAEGYAADMGAAVREGAAETEVAPPPTVSIVPPVVPPTAGAGSSFSWPVTTATIVEARLGLALHTQLNGSAVLVPTYELTGADGAVWSVIAVTDAHLDFSAAG